MRRSPCTRTIKYYKIAILLIIPAAIYLIVNITKDAKLKQKLDKAMSELNTRYSEVDQTKDVYKDEFPHVFSTMGATVRALMREGKIQKYQNNSTPKTTHFAPVRKIIPLKFSKHEKDDGLRVIYNRVPKCMSSTVISLVNMLYKENHFLWVRQTFSTFALKNTHPSHQSAELITDEFVGNATPSLMSKHVHFIDFTKFGSKKQQYHKQQNATLDRCIREKWSVCTDEYTLKGEGYFITIPYFCGLNDYCLNDTLRTLNKAKENVEKYYTIVGVTNEFNAFVRALELLFPKMFKNIERKYKFAGNKLHEAFKTRYKIAPNEETTKLARVMLKNDYEFYHFIKQRFYKQLSRLELIFNRHLLNSKINRT
ncbi:unnamed protein product [Owenia fusiformis]|uniref:Uncharacterized protein n=1 Tax=Owenia fusiformis TaxID=6347 RepID=A0A8S4P6F7_OWEFU|nr:unnamed protein product [Owenia fusiformis]